MNRTFRFTLCIVVAQIGAVSLRSQSVYHTPYTVTTIAGASSSAGSTDGTGAAARFRRPIDLARDAHGNIYVADADNHTIRKITRDGVVTTWAGRAGSAGYEDGAAGQARFNQPTGIAVDALGNAYVSDASHRIRKIAIDGVVTTLAGGRQSSGSIDGPGTQARFNSPGGLAVDNEGNVYVADFANHTIRKIAANGAVTTLAGSAGDAGMVNATGSAARFSFPADVAVDSTGNLYVVDSGNVMIRKVTSGGVVTSLAGSSHRMGSSDGTGEAARFTDPSGIAVDQAGNVIVSDAGGQTIRRISPGSEVTTLAGAFALFGSFADGTGNAARFKNPGGVAVDEFGRLYVADAGNNVIRRGKLVIPPPSLITDSGSAVPKSKDTATLRVTTMGQNLTYTWRCNGRSYEGWRTAFNIVEFHPANTGIYTYDVLGSGAKLGVSEPLIVGLSTDQKFIGGGLEILPANVRHPNGNYYDQISLRGSLISVTADPGQATRVSFTDLNDDIVQVEFAGAGTLSIVLDEFAWQEEPAKYHQPWTPYSRGHASLVIAGANETTNITVFTVGRATAFDPTGAYDLTKEISATNDPAKNGSPLFQGHAATDYDGFADIAFIAIQSTNGRFGGVRTANTSYFANRGFTGIYAPGVKFEGPVWVHDINASAEATPVLVVGSTSDARITGGSLAQYNHRAVQVSGISQLRFTAGSSSHGTRFEAQPDQGRLEEDEVDVTTRIVVTSP
jgi:sugar lactone lactonase YvrE